MYNSYIYKMKGPNGIFFIIHLYLFNVVILNFLPIHNKYIAIIVINDVLTVPNIYRFV